MTFSGAYPGFKRSITDHEHAPGEIAGRVPPEWIVVRIFFDIAGFAEDFEATGSAYTGRAGVAPVPTGGHPGAFDHQSALATYYFRFMGGGTACESEYGENNDDAAHDFLMQGARPATTRRRFSLAAA